MTGQIAKNDLQGFLEYLGGERTLVCPVDTGKVVEFQKVTSSETPVDGCDANINSFLMDDRVSYKSIKEFYFPQTELMFTFDNEDVIDNTNLQGYAIFGARPCDLEALRVMSIVYSTGKYTDPFFQRRFDANFLIGVGCIGNKPGCFCREMGVDKDFSDFCDIMLTDNGESYIVMHLSEKGNRELDKYHAEKANAQSTGEPSPCVKPSPCFILDTEKDDAFYFDIIDWKKVTEACKGCGICTYICPTCYCFDFKDVPQKGIAERYKCWDSCMYPKFTLHASGHNPRNKRHERYRQRVLHKYKYVPNNFDGVVSCTGCGRCVRSCPVGVNIREIVHEIADRSRNDEK